jgi:ligand-binding sensor domain-containing protein
LRILYWQPILATKPVWRQPVESLPPEVACFILFYGSCYGAIWIGTAGGRIFRLKDKEVTSFPQRNQAPRAARPLTEWRDRSGKIWEMEIVQNLARKLTLPSSGQPETITLRACYEDRDGNLWLGTCA